ncbi:DeoR/GlpR family DNA-binding transcription regulator [Lacipirellula sp.]|uniref:DeoR/GlpR family DNA-binding transcription regulator n=1 Tax=Lacipirellula sp. TaxID=2691419 RepID=UPI003D0D0665
MKTARWRTSPLGKIEEQDASSDECGAFKAQQLVVGSGRLSPGTRMGYFPHAEFPLLRFATHSLNASRPMGNAVRDKKLIEMIAANGECSIDQLATELGVSDMTIRRDLQSLAESGKIIRTHGGAAMAESVSFGFEFLKKYGQHQEAKEAIAKLAAGKVEEGQSVLLDSGTTTLAIATQLRAKPNITVVTTSLPIASRLQYAPKVEVLLLGGYVRPTSPDLVGALTESNLESLCADIAFIGAAGIDHKGIVYQQSPEVAKMLATMVKSAKVVYLVADSSKFGKTALCRCGKLQDWDGIITDRGVDKKLVESFAKKGVQVLLA